jgi:hypothetical protein
MCEQHFNVANSKRMLERFFATPASNEARNAIQIAFYWPQTNTVRLELKSETVFILMQKESYT